MILGVRGDTLADSDGRGLFVTHIYSFLDWVTGCEIQPYPLNTKTSTHPDVYMSLHVAVDNARMLFLVSNSPTLQKVNHGRMEWRIY